VCGSLAQGRDDAGIAVRVARQQVDRDGVGPRALATEQRGGTVVGP
jgi:hypothetical protein